MVINWGSPINQMRERQAWTRESRKARDAAQAMFLSNPTEGTRLNLMNKQDAWRHSVQIWMRLADRITDAEHKQLDREFVDWEARP
jgi:hypothetical protein